MKCLIVKWSSYLERVTFKIQIIIFVYKQSGSCALKFWLQLPVWEIHCCCWLIPLVATGFTSITDTQNFSRNWWWTKILYIQGCHSTTELREVTGRNPLNKGCLYRDYNVTVYVVLAMAQTTLLLISLLPADVCMFM